MYKNRNEIITICIEIFIFFLAPTRTAQHQHNQNSIREMILLFYSTPLKRKIVESIYLILDGKSIVVVRMAELIDPGLNFPPVSFVMWKNETSSHHSHSCVCNIRSSSSFFCADNYGAIVWRPSCRHRAVCVVTGPAIGVKRHKQDKVASIIVSSRERESSTILCTTTGSYLKFRCVAV